MEVKIFGKANPFKVRIICGFDYVWVKQSIFEKRRKFFFGEVNSLNRLIAKSITQKQYFKIRRLNVFINAVGFQLY